MGDSSRPIRSYQRIFTPDRRIYQIDGRRLPVPGGVPLAWLAWAFISLVTVLILSQRSLLLAVGAGAIAGVAGASAQGWRGAVTAGVCTPAVLLVLGVLLAWVAWPLRLIVLPALLATLAARPSSDGRAMHRYLMSWLAVRVRAARRSLGRPVVLDGESQVWAPRVWIAADHHSPVLQHGRVRGPARLVFNRTVVAIPARGRLIVRPADGHRLRRGEQIAQVIELDTGQILEVRP